MKLIEAYIPPDALDQVRRVLLNQGVEDLVTSEITVAQKDDDRPRWRSFASEYVPQVKVELVVFDELAGATAQHILDIVRTRRSASPVQIVIGRVEEIVRIDTGQRGPAAF
jgi:nitrogen regulatory protein PII